MNLLENLYKSLSHEKIWGPDGLTPLNNFKANSGGFTACCPNPAHPEKKPSASHKIIDFGSLLIISGRHGGFCQRLVF